eukprot:SAG31_NODE_7708_length_1612_cov_1.053536_2_plen_445_part_01
MTMEILHEKHSVIRVFDNADSELTRTDSEITTRTESLIGQTTDRAVLADRINEWFRHLDADDNGTLTVAEIEAGFRRMGLPFGNRDRVAVAGAARTAHPDSPRLDLVAFSDLILDRLRRRRGLELPGLESPPVRPKLVLSENAASETKVQVPNVDAADANHEAVPDRGTLASRIRGWFDRLDEDCDGTLTLAEVETGFQRMGLPFGDAERSAMALGARTLKNILSSNECRLDFDSFANLIIARIRRRQEGSSPVERGGWTLSSPVSPTGSSLSTELNEVLALTSSATKHNTDSLRRIRSQRAEFERNLRTRSTEETSAEELTSPSSSRPRIASAPPAQAVETETKTSEKLGVGVDNTRNPSASAALAPTQSTDRVRKVIFRDGMKIHVEHHGTGNQSSIKMTLDELRERVQRGETKPRHLVWWKGLQAWLALEEALLAHPAFADA